MLTIFPASRRSARFYWSQGQLIRGTSNEETLADALSDFQRRRDAMVVSDVLKMPCEMVLDI